MTEYTDFAGHKFSSVSPVSLIYKTFRPSGVNTKFLKSTIEIGETGSKNIILEIKNRDEIAFVTDENIPAHNFDAEIIYQIKAFDNDFDLENEADRSLGISDVSTLIIVDDDTTPPDFTDLPDTEMQDGQTFLLGCTITDISGIYEDDVYLIWDNDGTLDESSTTVQMLAIGNDYFETAEELPIQSHNADFVYRIFAYDNDFDNENADDRTQGNTDILQITFTDDDTDPPVFSDFSTDPQALDDVTPFYVQCTIADPSGVYSAQLIWSNTADFAESATIQMEHISDNVYKTVDTIPPQDTGEAVFYKVVAVDNDFDDNDPTDRTEGTSLVNEVGISDDDTTPPQFTDFAPSQIGDTQTFFITCNISDDSGIFDDETGSDGQGVYIKWGYDEEVSEGEFTMSPQDIARSKSKSSIRGREQVAFITDEAIGLQPSGETFYYKVFAFDNDFDNANSNDRIQGESDVQSIEILDDDTSPPTFSNFLPTRIPAGEEFFIQCDISDSTGVNDEGEPYNKANPQPIFSVTLLWDSDGEIDLDWNLMEMDAIGGNRGTTVTYRTVKQIPAQEPGSQFVFAVYACDTDFDGPDGGYISDSESGNSLSAQGLPNEVTIQPLGEFDNAYVYPNPAPTDEFPNEIHFRYFLEENQTQILVQVFDVLGDLIWEKEKYYADGHDYCDDIGTACITWDITDIASGLYIFRIQATSPSGTKEVIKKLAIAK